MDVWIDAGMNAARGCSWPTAGCSTCQAWSVHPIALAQAHTHSPTFILTPSPSPNPHPPSPTFTTLTHPTSTPTRPLCLTHWPCESPDHSSSHSPISPPPADATGHYVSCLVVPLSHTHKQSTRGVGGPVVGTSVGRAKRASQIHTLAISRWASQSMGRSVIHGHLSTRTTRSYIGTSAHGLLSHT